MSERIKFQVLSSTGRWRTAYCRPELLAQNIDLFVGYGYTVRHDGTTFKVWENAA